LAGVLSRSRSKMLPVRAGALCGAGRAPGMRWRSGTRAIGLWRCRLGDRARCFARRFLRRDDLARDGSLGLCQIPCSALACLFLRHGPFPLPALLARHFHTKDAIYSSPISLAESARSRVIKGGHMPTSFSRVDRSAWSSARAPCLPGACTTADPPPSPSMAAALPVRPVRRRWRSGWRDDRRPVCPPAPPPSTSRQARGPDDATSCGIPATIIGQHVDGLQLPAGGFVERPYQARSGPTATGTFRTASGVDAGAWSP